MPAKGKLKDQEFRQRILDEAVVAQSVDASARAVGISGRTLRRYRKDNPGFAEAHDSAMAGCVVELTEHGNAKITATVPAVSDVQRKALTKADTVVVDAAWADFASVQTPRDQYALLVRMQDDANEDVRIRLKAMEIASKVAFSAEVHALILRAEKRVAREVEMDAVDTTATESAPPQPLVFAAIPSNGSEAPGHAPAEVIDLEVVDAPETGDGAS